MVKAGGNDLQQNFSVNVFFSLPLHGLHYRVIYLQDQIEGSNTIRGQKNRNPLMQTDAVVNVVLFLNHLCKCEWIFKTQTTASKLSQSGINTQKKWKIMISGIFIHPLLAIGMHYIIQGFSVFYSLTKFSERFHFLALSWWKHVY